MHAHAPEDSTHAPAGSASPSAAPQTITSEDPANVAGHLENAAVSSYDAAWSPYAVTHRYTPVAPSRAAGIAARSATTTEVTNVELEISRKSNPWVDPLGVRGRVAFVNRPYTSGSPSGCVCLSSTARCVHSEVVGAGAA